MARFINPHWNFEEAIDSDKIMRTIEKAGRTCYKSENNISDGSAEKFISNIIKLGHESVLEHEKITVRIICDRGISHELVRHRIASYSQESTRYCNYSNNKFDNELTFIIPPQLSKLDMSIPKYQDLRIVWQNAMEEAETRYMSLITLGNSISQSFPILELARDVLPMSIKTEIVVTMNLREWRHFFKMRCSPHVHPDMRTLALSLLDGFKEKLPVIFDETDYN